MSATGRNLEGKERRALDFYETEGWVTRSILEAVDVSGSVLDAGCGTGAILREVIKMRGPKLSIAYGIELDQARMLRANEDETTRGHVFQGDFLTYPETFLVKNCGKRYDVVIANPPYALAQEFVDAARLVGDVVIFLLRLNFLGSQKRASIFAKYMPDVYVLPKRPSFTGDGRTDATEYAWFVWGRENARERPMFWTPGIGSVQVLRVPEVK